MSLSNAISYGEAVGKAIWNYFGLTDYAKLEISKLRERAVPYDDVHELWDDVIKSVTDDNDVLKLRNGRVVELIDFTFTEWFPWLPGMYWSPYGFRDKLGRDDELNIIEKGIFTSSNATYWAENKNGDTENYNDGDAMLPKPNSREGLLTPNQKALSVLSGIGVVRMDVIESVNGPIKVLGATRFRDDDGEPNVSGGVPVVMTQNAYERLRQVESNGVVKATVEGMYIELPASLNNIFRGALDIRRFCIYVGSEFQIRESDDEADDITAAGWTLYEDSRNGGYGLAFGNFKVASEGPERAARFLRWYLREHHGIPLTDFDEKTHHFEATYPITQITSGYIDNAKFRRLVDKIRQRYPLSSNDEY